MVAFRAISTALAVAAVAQPILATSYDNVDFSDNYVAPGQVKPLTYSHGYVFECFDLLGGVLNAAGDIIEDVLATLGGILGGGKKPSYGHGISIVGGIGGHYKRPGHIYHQSGKPFNVISLKALCCAADLSSKCNILDCHIKLTGYDKQTGGNKIYSHDFYVPKSYNKDATIAAIDVDVNVDGIVTLGRPGLPLLSVDVEVDLLNDLKVDAKVNTGRGRYSYPPTGNYRDVAVGSLLNIILDADL
ncbi:hypothetical protein H072_4440 [Dactylellina haptotyla CBS 200.50]|uniref:Uncharacterized protein n=1 Tax=Dactylellina haptotyla (strain CBS 200.50) TaxID=1284197 RepID=S8AFK1_DACHA|nr:hypothetical protein H072_4440 [Dactylellina haptotyla CBS 200.50]